MRAVGLLLAAALALAQGARQLPAGRLIVGYAPGCNSAADQRAVVNGAMAGVNVVGGWPQKEGEKRTQAADQRPAFFSFVLHK